MHNPLSQDSAVAGQSSAPKPVAGSLGGRDLTPASRLPLAG
ncbi:hypothetical protein [Nigerium massiliense]|nr:hypothetical protein [Nigerium massiliense]